ncbi:endonuclease/exonuclease/phosphatase family protein [Nonomuraea gerenzanensis]|uniref:Integral membrane protein n=1 Tax=Nonomuraea gerenzanensis TaxID=93944 RepID=A0A1M4EA44_9ACTN|nr:endonuclease/exonuclease/phosphatase family protein [Nonomuraea gerenzanensis]UBU17978.1 endonuclease/exonuclease/phosphatase family protein [Nonomuraea gerenzanensis]SBO95781.1 Integral membrane protein [Nonomuraea gerenzanensis]
MLVEEAVKTERRARPRGVWRRRVAVGLAVLFAAGTAVRLGGLEAGVFLVPMVSFTPYFALAALLMLGIAALLRSRAAIAVMLAVCLCLAWCVLPRALGGGGDGGDAAAGRTLRVLTANLNGGRGDATVIVELVRSLNVDVLSIQELTYSARDRLAAAGLARLLPYHLGRADFRGPEGSGVYSRYPMTERTGLFQPVGHHMPVAEVALPGGSAVEVVVVHPVAPVPSTVPEWEAGVASLPPAPSSGAPRVLAGDFNATLDHAVFRRLLDTGYTDAAASTGQGLTPTWPHGRSLPPLVTIDHVLTDGRGTAVRTQVFDVPGSDHRALFADLRVKG